MPVYTYRCDNCGHQFDKQQSFSEEALRGCPECRKHALYKVYKPTGVVFKGSGFYVTDKRSAKSSTVTSSNGKESSESKPVEKSAAKSTETKTEKKEPAKKTAD